MKTLHCSIIISFLFFSFSLIGQTPPPERFTLEGALTIGNSNTPLPPKGTIRWNSANKDFEGYNGSTWVSFTAGSSEFGVSQPYRYESQILIDEDGSADENFGEAVAIEGDYYAVGTPETNGGQGAVFLYDDGDLIAEIEMSGSNELGEQVDISGDWIAIGADDNNAYVYNISKENLLQLKINNSVNLTQFIAIDGNLLAVKGADSTVYTFIESAGEWQELGQTSAKEVASAGFDISEEGHLVAQELGETHVITFEYQNNNWVEGQTIEAPAGFRSSKPSLYGNTMAINYTWKPSVPAVQETPKQGFVKVFNYQNGSWTEQAKIYIPNIYFLESPVINDDIIIIGSGILGANTNQVLHNGQGKVHVLKKTGSFWNYKYSLTSSDGRAGDIFGFDYDVGTKGIIVGALWADARPGYGLYESNRQGKAYIFKK